MESKRNKLTTPHEAEAWLDTNIGRNEQIDL